MVNAGDVVRASDVSVQGCRVTRAAAQSIPDNVVFTTVAFDSERFDTDGMHSTTTNNSRITINTAGIYIVGFNGTFQSGSDYTTAFALLLVNGATEIIRGPRQQQSTSLQPHVTASCVHQFDAGDYVEVQVYQDNTAGAARNLDKTDERSPEFYAARIGS